MSSRTQLARRGRSDTSGARSDKVYSGSRYFTGARAVQPRRRRLPLAFSKLQLDIVLTKHTPRESPQGITDTVLTECGALELSRVATQ